MNQNDRPTYHYPDGCAAGAPDEDTVGHQHVEVRVDVQGRPSWFNREPDRSITAERMVQYLVEQFKL